MTLRDCINTRVTNSSVKKSLLEMADDESLAAGVVEEVRVAKGRVHEHIATVKKFDMAAHEMGTFQRRGLLNPDTIVHDPWLYVRNIVSGGAGSIEEKASSLVSIFHSKIDDTLRKAKLPGVKGKLWALNDPMWERMVARVLHGTKVENAEITAFGDAFKELTREIGELRNKAGGWTNVKDDFGINHVHAPDKIRGVPKEEWQRDFEAAFKVDIRAKAGEVKTTQDVIDRTYTNMVDPKKYKAAGFGTSLRRQFEVKDADAWFDYNLKYGEKNMFGSIMSYIDNSAREIAALERLGRKPRETLRRLEGEAGRVVKDLQIKGKVVKDGSSRAGASIDRYNAFAGYENAGNPNYIALGQGVRVFNVVTKLGKAPITAITDVAFGQAASMYKGMPVMKTLRKQLVSLGSKGNHKFLSQMGVISDVVMDDVMAAHRMADITGNGTALKIANVFTKAIGLNRWTNAMRVGHSYEFLAHITNLGNTPYNKLHKGLRGVLGEHGIDEGAWSHLANAKRIKNKGAEFIDPMQIEDFDVRANLVSMIQSEARYAVPEPNAATRAALSWGKAPGTLAGELLRTATQFKSFPVTTMMMQIARIRAIPSKRARAYYTANLLAGTTIMGGMAIWIKDILNGRDPREISPEFIFESLVQGGASGLIGDVFKDTGLHGRSIAELFGGPSVGMVDAPIRAGFDLITGSKNAEEVFGKLGSDVLNSVSNSASYGKIVLDNLLIQGASEYINPAYGTKQRRTKKRMRDKGQGYFWRPGEATPRRAPKAPKVSKEIKKAATLTF